MTYDTNIGAHLMVDLLEAYGEYPVLAVSEDNLLPSVTWPPSYTIFVDTAKLDQIDDYELGYVQRIIMAALRDEAQDRLRIAITTTQKYSFGDTAEWWAEISLDRLPKTRRVISIEVERT